MIQEFTLDLRAARRNSGLRQVDCAHLMGVHKTKISNFENGRQRPSIKDICLLSMIYGRSFESLFAGIFEEVRQDLADNLPSLPEPTPHYGRRLNRERTLRSLEGRLKDNPEGYDS
ncbi:helix-turn-helix domain-containing protein [Pseudohalocynthiibacter sp. F2068]|jgi:transcriptional regulator with XRE-family HTH domain|nr:helix-turn-helix domain-containing protein [Pseudohalocynthiibacter sp. F2068]